VSIKRFLKETKKGVETKILGVILYHRGLSYRDTSKILGMIEPSSYEAIHYWYKQFHKLSEETWVFWENETFNNYRVSTKYEYGGSGSMSCSWSAKDNKITLCSESYTYVFSNDKTLVTLEKDNEKIVLNKIV